MCNLIVKGDVLKNGVLKFGLRKWIKGVEFNNTVDMILFISELYVYSAAPGHTDLLDVAEVNSQCIS